MTENTAIAWATHSFNPWVGCTNVSPGCDNCYAETLTKRWGQDVWGAGKPRRRTAPSNWKKPLQWARLQMPWERVRVFPSMCDPFDAEVSDEWRNDFFALIEQTPSLDWLLLTKRPNLITKKVPAKWLEHPPRNVWYGTSVESQPYQWRIDALAEVPAAIRFLSIEPLIEEIPDLVLDGIHWVIVGGESGPNRRPMDLAWAQDIKRQCRAAGVAFFFKQIGALRPGQGEDALGEVYHEFPTAALL